MSIKHRVKDRDNSGKIRPLWRTGYDTFSREPVRWGFVVYSKNPAWWNREFNNRPKRSEARQLCKAIAAGRKDADAAIFPLEHKPNYYYW
ncbi:hypothetical protein SB5439_05137 [Klebsiella variicola]|uniref:hypothetical protein n=1 Tax=Klebsiella variicola TaxID=244366 RepID=UPI00109D48D6|nr:hypothetical protein [Klebsiella variicola]VGQ13073.1 hypothetical protein SB5439_05137 [Klebsiella variicola]